MVSQEHLDILQQGVETWNQWREEHTDIQPDLSDADLRKAKLSHANLQRALLTGANLFNIEFPTDCATRGR